MARQNAPVRMGGVSAKYIHNHWGDGMAEWIFVHNEAEGLPPKVVQLIDGLRAAEAILALLALIALPFTRGIPTVQPGSQVKPRPSPA